MLLQTDTRTYLELQPVVPLGAAWEIAVGLLIGVAMISWTVWLWRKDSVDLNRPASVCLLALRMTAIGALLLYVLNPGLRSETRLTKDSRLVFLIDESLSMGLSDRSAPANGSTDSNQQSLEPTASVTRVSQVAEIMSSDRIAKLQENHQLAIYRFSETDQPTLLAELPKRSTAARRNFSTDDSSQREGADVAWRSSAIGWLALAIGILAVVLMIRHFLLPRQKAEDAPSSLFGTWWFTVGALLLVVATAVLGYADLVLPRAGLLETMGLASAGQTEEADDFFGDQRSTQRRDSEGRDQKDGDSNAPDGSTPGSLPEDWLAEILPRGTSTRIGSAIDYLVNKEQGGPIAGICLLSDGQSNEGVSVDRATAAAANAGIPIYTIGIGSPNQPQNVLIAELQAPARVFPGDKFLIKGLVKAFGLEGKTARVQLLSVDEEETEAYVLEDEQSIRLLTDGTPAGVEFAVSRDVEGKRRYEMRIESFEEDLDQRDNNRRCFVEVVKQKTNVLLIAGGPTREFRFLRNQLYRDDEIFLNVWLQTAQSGADQESDVLLNSFPESREELYEIDCIVAFDPDWRKLTLEQSELLEKWIAQQAGGLITIAGPVNTPQWTRQPRGDSQIDIIRRIYPVAFYNQGSAVLKLGRFGGTTPFPLEFTRAGRSADFLWIGDSAGLSQETWARFEGVFGYYAVNEPKDGADVLANFGDPDTAIDNVFPIYLASQFYGAGRVFFQASGEMWRVRRLDVEYFQQYYTKLIRWASQGRLNRDSTRGVLLVDRERCWMGDTVAVEAILKDAQDEPLRYPQVEAVIKLPLGISQPIVLRSNPAAANPGSFSGSFVANAEGEFVLQLPVPESPNQDVLTLSVFAGIPDLEKEKPQRNDAVLAQIAEKTGGSSFLQSDATAGSSVHSLSTLELIAAQDQETIIAGTFDRFFKRQFMMWTLIVMTLCLTMQWTLRRLQKLA